MLRSLVPSSSLSSVLLLGAGALLAAVGCSKQEPAPAAAPSSSAAPKPAAAASSSRPVEVPFEEQVAQSKPLAPTPQKQVAGPIELTATPCAIAGGNPVHKSTTEVFRAVRAVGDRLWVVGGDDKVRAYRVAPGADCKLSPDDRISADGTLAIGVKARTLSTDSAGKLYVSNGVFAGAVVSKDGKLEYECNARPGGYVALHPKGAWGLGHFANATVAKVELSPTACKSSPWVLQDLSQPGRKGPLTNVNTIAFLGDTALVGGIIAKEVDPNSPRVVVAMDASGKELFRFGNPAPSASGEDRFGWVHAIAPCKHGICVVDSNYRRMTLWKKDKGEFIAAINLANLLGLRYPTVNDLTVAPGGAYLVAGQSRDGSKVAEGLIYRVSGI